MPLHQFPSSNPTCLILTDNRQRPISLIGKIAVQGTGNRASPPDCISGFLANGTPFSKGHIMALELGGPDVAENIVPQYNLWQANYDWRTMEVNAASSSIATTGNGIFIVQLGYANNNDTYAASYLQFQINQNKLTTWDDYRITTDYKIWLADPSTTGGAIINQVFSSNSVIKEQCLQEIATGGSLINLSSIQRLVNPTPTTTSTATAPSIPPTPIALFNSFTSMNVMPAGDRSYWRNQMLISIVRKHHQKLVDDYNASLNTSPVQNDVGIRASKRLRGTGGTTVAVSTDPGMYGSWATRRTASELLAIVKQYALTGWTLSETTALTGGDIITAIS
jgi:hypothetical protein